MNTPEKPKNLVIVAGHAAFNTEVTPDELPDAPFEAPAEPWVLASFQKGEPHYYGEHMQNGIGIASQDPDSLLVASGGFTRNESVGGRHNWSEAGSYLTAAERSGWFTTTNTALEAYQTPDGSTIYIPFRTIEAADGHEQRVASNEYARDSIENVLGDIATFMALTEGDVPRHVTVVGWKFKEERFKEHAEAIGIPDDRFTYEGVNNPQGDDLIGAKKGEEKALSAFQKDPLGRKFEGQPEHPEYPGSLAQKRDDRDPLKRDNPHWEMLDEIRTKFSDS